MHDNLTENSFCNILISTESGREDASKLRRISAFDYYSFHVRKPNWTIEELRCYLSNLPDQWRRIVVLHQHFELARYFDIKGIHLNEKNKQINHEQYKIISASYHSLAQLKSEVRNFDYVFLSPIFNSITKPAYKAGFDVKELEGFLENTTHKVIALGGVTRTNAIQCKKLGFSGAAFLGDFWIN